MHVYRAYQEHISLDYMAYFQGFKNYTFRGFCFKNDLYRFIDKWIHIYHIGVYVSKTRNLSAAKLRRAGAEPC